MILYQLVATGRMQCFTQFQTINSKKVFLDKSEAEKYIPQSKVKVVELELIGDLANDSPNSKATS